MAFAYTSEVGSEADEVVRTLNPAAPSCELTRTGFTNISEVEHD